MHTLTPMFIVNSLFTAINMTSNVSTLSTCYKYLILHVIIKSSRNANTGWIYQW